MKLLKVDKIVDQLQQFVQSYDLAALRDYWSYLDRRLFSRLEDVYRPTVNKLKTSLFRYYLVHAIQLFALQAESSRMKKEELEVEQTVVHHKLPAYVANMDRLGDSELKKAPSRPAHTSGASPTQTGSVLLGKKEPINHQSAKVKEGTVSCKDGKSHFTGLVSGESSSLQQRQKRLQEHGKERKELLSKGTFQGQSAEKKTDTGIAETETCSEPHAEQTETSAKMPASSAEAVGVRQEQPFIVLSQEEYGEHHSSIMYCRVDCSGRRVASLDVDGVIKVWSFNPIMQTKASSISKSPLLSLEWATKRDRLLLLGSGVGTVRLYDTEAKKNLCEISIDEDMPRILSLGCSPSGASFVCSAAAQSAVSHVDFSVVSSGGKSMNQVPGKLLLWDTKTMKQQLQFSLEPEPIAINCTAFNHNGNLLVTGAADGIVRLFDMQQHECAMSWKAHDGEVYSVEFSYDENTVYSIGEDGKFIQWNIHKSGLKVSEYDLPSEATGPFVLSGYSGYKQVQFPRGRLFAFDSEGNYMLTCSSTGGVIFKVSATNYSKDPELDFEMLVLAFRS
ncbi:WD repeat-containing protein 91 [Willisornis vidua]|uniref:WD repeat-containing protein 91 n=1 Tax=Willisornis vidua TaxID=1566151 RepID=A0ABQ9CRT3_9PASS|nr:WD repeat-containing protein 91 [Willisornis vidua]